MPLSHFPLWHASLPEVCEGSPLFTNFPSYQAFQRACFKFWPWGLHLEGPSSKFPWFQKLSTCQSAHGCQMEGRHRSRLLRRRNCSPPLNECSSFGSCLWMKVHSKACRSGQLFTLTDRHLCCKLFWFLFLSFSLIIVFMAQVQWYMTLIPALCR